RSNPCARGNESLPGPRPRAGRHGCHPFFGEDLTAMTRTRKRRFRPALEGLEERLVPYALTGYQWASTNVSVSYLPDGTSTEGYTSNLFATLNASLSTATWQREFARALQTWADVTPLNFHFVGDDGSPSGTTGLWQGDSRFGDIRLGMHPLSAGYAGWAYAPAGPSTLAGDITLASSGFTFNVGTWLDLYSLLLHETGHSIGLDHSTLSTAVMYPSIMGVYTGLSADDIAGAQAIYGARQADAYDAASPNDTLASATALALDSSGALSVSADLTSLADVDFYRVVAPTGSDGTLTVSVDARNLSLLIPKVSVYDAAGNLLATADAGAAYGGVAAVSLTGLSAGQAYYLVADGGTTDVFGMGAYKLTAQFGLAAPPPPPGPAPDRYEADNTAATAANLGKTNSISQTGLTFHTATDVDYYSFTPSKSGTFTLSVAPTQGSGTVDFTVLDAQQNVVAHGQSSSGGVVLTASLSASVRYYLKAFSPDGSLLTYSLTAALAGGSGTKSGSPKGHGALAVAPGDGTTAGPGQSAASDGSAARALLKAAANGVGQPTGSAAPGKSLSAPAGDGLPAGSGNSAGVPTAVVVPGAGEVGASFPLTWGGRGRAGQSGLAEETDLAAELP
ncbi:MAG TPA: matrixin family metalloprotease, partial [Gemmataceae bacterium]|nr:matrixin family metalloprotease [Gemmataceae bacterium]